MSLVLILIIILLVFTLIASLGLLNTSKIVAILIYCVSAVALVATLSIFFKSCFAQKIEFLHPKALYLIFIPFVALLIQALRQTVKQGKINFPFSHLKIATSSFRTILTRWFAYTLYTIALALLLFAFARPVIVNKTILPPTEGIDIMLVMDLSASMQKKDFYPNRFSAAQQTAKRFISKRFNDRIGLVVFAKNALLQAPLTLDYEALDSYISDLYLGMIDSSMTAIGDALAVATSHLKDSTAKSKVIILLTDGDSNAGAIDPLLAAKATATYGIKVYTIGTASAPNQGIYSNQHDEINEGLMLEIATLTNGKFYRAKNETELTQIYDTINELEKTEFSSNSSISRQDIYHPFLMLALIFIFVAFVAEKIFLIRIP